MPRRPDPDVHRYLEALAGDVGDAAAEGILGREGNRVDHEVEPAPVGGDAVEDGFELAVGHDVHRHEDRCLTSPASGSTWGLALSLR